MVTGELMAVILVTLVSLLAEQGSSLRKYTRQLLHGSSEH